MDLKPFSSLQTSCLVFDCHHLLRNSQKHKDEHIFSWGVVYLKTFAIWDLDNGGTDTSFSPVIIHVFPDQRECHRRYPISVIFHQMEPVSEQFVEQTRCGGFSGFDMI